MRGVFVLSYLRVNACGRHNSLSKVPWILTEPELCMTGFQSPVIGKKQVPKLSSQLAWWRLVVVALSGSAVCFPLCALGSTTSNSSSLSPRIVCPKASAPRRGGGFQVKVMCHRMDLEYFCPRSSFYFVFFIPERQSE